MSKLSEKVINRLDSGDMFHYFTGGVDIDELLLYGIG